MTDHHWRTATVVLTALLVVLGSGWALSWAASQGTTPSQSSPEVGFARDMFVHHDQAVVMSFLVRERSDDPQVGTLALDVAQGQSTDQGRLLAWLDAHEVGAPTSEYEQMAWMTSPSPDGSGHAAHSPAASPPAGVDPMIASMGMATDEQLSELGRLTGHDAEVLYLQLMHEHHQGGVEMARAFLDRSDEPTLSELAEAMVTTQQRELTIIENLLAERGAPVPSA